MKKLSLVLAAVTCIILTSCKKEVSPELEITVVDTQGSPKSGAKVRISVDQNEFKLINAKAIDSSRTDGFGKAYFKFDNTIIVDVALFNGSEITDSLSVLCETKRLKRNEKNVTERKLIFD